MRESIEAIDHRLMPEREVEIERLAEHDVERNCARLVVAILRMLERHVEEGALIARKLFVEAVGDRPLGEIKPSLIYELLRPIWVEK
jgi:hypothetical protein